MVDDLCLYFQPIKPVDRPCRSIHAEGELLLRTEAGESLGAAFFQDAEQMPIVDEWVVAQLSMLLPTSDHRYHVNLSPFTLDRPGFAEFFCARIGDNRERVTVEVTETAPFSDRALEAIAKLRRCYPVVLDDLGSGHSSLCHFLKAEVDGFKIDGCLVSAIVHSVKARRIVESLIRLAAQLDCRCVAEYVEDAWIWSFLAEMKLRIAPGLPMQVQGWAVGKPHRMIF